MEVEAKFAITGPFEPETLSQLALSPYTLRPAGVERHSDVLLDTPSRAVTGALHALRIRTIGKQRILTLKGPNRGEGGVHEREEVEAPLSGPLSYDPREWPPEIGERASAFAHGEPFLPLLRVQVERRLWMVRRSGRVVGEMALDTGEIIAAGRHEPLHELELELKGNGARADLDILRDMLMRALPLAPESRSKLERGLALLRHTRWALDGYTPLDAVVRHGVRRHLRTLRIAQRRVLSHGDADAIHDMRVATRRIRTTLQAVEGAGVYKDKRLWSLRRRLHTIAIDLGEARDLDIFLERVDAWTDANRERERDLEPLRDLLVTHRQAAYEGVIKRLGKRKHARLMLDLERFISDEAHPAAGQPCLLTRHFAGSVIWPRYEAVLRYETVAAEAEPPTLHQLRIACKRLRYALEIFATPLGAGVVPLRKALVAAQSHLGDVQDLTVGLQLVSRLRHSDPENAGLIAYEQALLKERTRLIEQVDDIWQPLRSQRLRDALSQTLAAL